MGDADCIGLGADERQYKIVQNFRKTKEAFLDDKTSTTRGIGPRD